MKYKYTVFIAQLVFLVIVPKNRIYASSSNDFVYDGKDFGPAEACELVQKTTYPFYVVKQDLTNNHVQLHQGTLVNLKKNSSHLHNEKSFTIIKNPLKTDRIASGTQKLPLDQVDIPSNWSFRISEAQDTPFVVQNKVLQLEVTDNKVHYRRCCTHSKCIDLPIFTVSDSQSIIGKIAFTPSTADFIDAYTAQKKGLQPRTQRTALTTASTRALSIEEPAEAIPAATVPPVSSAQQKVICTQTSPLRIYNDSLKTVIYRAPKFLPVKVYQSWDGGPSEKTVKGHTLVKVQLTTGGGKEIIGWAAGSFIKPAAECKDMPLIYSKDGEEEVIPGATVFVDSPANCCRFPTLKPPSAGYNQGDGRRYFGARRRDGKRQHAAADLLRPTGEKVLSIDDGRVLRKYHFYADTYAIEVKHDSGYVARYGEVAKKNVAQSGPGERIIKGQHIGDIGSLRMLHFEIYSDKASGPLTQRENGAFWRRSDLLNPTPLLNKWQEMTF